ncbi:helix-turn-helix domain-containing protein [Hoeflea sp.]|uniref:helix-turn-helix domain-containing protein n=1 Tax=Hoeflea sp. TaxID=1940281 RepID=UPI003B5166BC
MKTPRQKILDEVAEIARLNGVPMRDLMGRCRTKDVVRARKAAMWFVWFKYNKSFNAVAAIFGRKEHSAVAFAIGAHLLDCGITDMPVARMALRIRNKARAWQKMKREQVAASQETGERAA